MPNYKDLDNVQKVERLFPEEKFNDIFPFRDPVYTYNGFLQAVGKFPKFCNEKGPLAALEDYTED